MKRMIQSLGIDVADLLDQHDYDITDAIIDIQSQILDSEFSDFCIADDHFTKIEELVSATAKGGNYE